MPKINTIVKVEKKDQLEIAKRFCRLQPCKIQEDEATGSCYACKIGSSIKATYNQGQEDYGNKSVELDIDEIKKAISEVPFAVKLLMPSQIVFLAYAIKCNTDKIIVEAKEK